MKKLIAAIAVLVLTTSAYAKDEKDQVNFRVMSTFNGFFKDATDIQWSVTEQYAKASFMLDGERREAYYNLDGELIGASRAMTMIELPRTAQKTIAKKYAGYTLKEAIEFSNDDFVDYYVSMENEKQVIVFKISRAGDFSIFKTSKK